MERSLLQYFLLLAGLCFYVKLGAGILRKSQRFGRRV